jgi:hypothetical protein
VAQQQIARAGADGCVERREVDQIEAEERGVAIAPPPALEDVPQTRKEGVVIEQPGQRIVARRSLGLAGQGAGDARAGPGAVGASALAQNLRRRAARDRERKNAEQGRQVTGRSRHQWNACAQQYPDACDQAVEE